MIRSENFGRDDLMPSEKNIAHVKVKERLLTGTGIIATKIKIKLDLCVQ